MGKHTITASELKARSSQVLERVVQTRTPVTITRRGRPIARIVPVDDAPASLYGAARGSVKILGDIIEPIDVTWEATR